MRYIYLLLSVLFSLNLFSQNLIGIPQINTYGNLDYKGGTQNWDIDQDKNGVLYFANNEGLLTFDGRHWKLYSQPHETIVRSVKVAPDGKIFVGAQDEIGYYYPDKSGTLRFTSLRNLIPKNEQQFSDVWDISIVKNDVFFRTTNKIFHLKNNVIMVHKPTGQWEFMGGANGKLYAQDVNRGLLAFQNGKWELISSSESFLKDYITSILDYSKDTLLITTLKSGLYLMAKDFSLNRHLHQDENFIKHRIYKALKVNNDWFAIATSSGGCFIINKAGQVIQHFSSKEGLNKNNLRSIFLDKNKNIWLGLDDGINFISFNNAIKFIYPDREKQISGYSTLIHDKKLYIGTSNGVFYNNLSTQNSDLSYSRQPFNEISNTSGQVWGLREINDNVLVSHEDGAFVIKDNSAIQLYRSPGTWLFEPLSPTNIIAGTYLGLQSISYIHNKFINNGGLKSVSEPLRFLFHHKKALWASHPYRGIYRFKLSDDERKVTETKLYSENEGLPSSLGNYIFKIKGKVIAATKSGILEFSEESGKFIPSTLFHSISGHENYQYLKEDKEGDVWFISNKKVGLMVFSGNENKTPYIVHFPELTSQIVAGFENIYPYNKENIFIGANKGLIHINYKKYIKNIKPLKVTLSLIKATGKEDSTIFGGYFLDKNKKIQSYQDNDKVELENHFNSLHLEYSSTLYEQQNNIEFSYQLVGFDKSWSEWSSKSEKDYTNLPFGDYIFNIKARNNLGNESEIVSFSFYIKPAWYETFWIYILYIIAVLAVVYLLIRNQKKKHIKEQVFLKLQHQREIEDNEKEIVKLQNEKLEAEVNFKNKELATTSMHLVQKNKLLSKIKEELLPLVKLDHADSHSDDLKKVLRLLNDAEKGDADWEQFAIHFDHVHSNFLSTLKEMFPNLSANDLKLCAYLKMNLSSKEMAQLMSITIRAVEVSRYRLRKKLNVASDINLFDYLISVTSSNKS